MAKEISQLEVKILDTDNPGTPDRVSYSCQIIDSEDNALAKAVRGVVESPECWKILACRRFDSLDKRRPVLFFIIACLSAGLRHNKKTRLQSSIGINKEAGFQGAEEHLMPLDVVLS